MSETDTETQRLERAVVEAAMAWNATRSPHHVLGQSEEGAHHAAVLSACCSLAAHRASARESQSTLPKWPADVLGCDRACHFETAGIGLQCQGPEGMGGCRRYLHPGEPEHDSVSAYYRAHRAEARAEVDRDVGAPMVRFIVNRDSE